MNLGMLKPFWLFLDFYRWQCINHCFFLGYIANAKHKGRKKEKEKKDKIIGFKLLTNLTTIDVLFF
jgi:hypothetical protein